MQKMDIQTRTTVAKLETLKKSAVKNARRHFGRMPKNHKARGHYYLWLQTARGYGQQLHSLLNKTTDVADQTA